MGREVRRVPPNWEHPQEGSSSKKFKPMFDITYADARKDWLDGLADHKPEEHDGLDYWEYNGNPPEREDYRTYSDAEATWFQVYETVSEGTPVTPPFETKDELVQYLATHGDLWDQRRGNGGWPVENARAFVNSGWAPSMIINGGKVMTARDIPPHEV